MKEPTDYYSYYDEIKEEYYSILSKKEIVNDLIFFKKYEVAVASKLTMETVYMIPSWRWRIIGAKGMLEKRIKLIGENKHMAADPFCYCSQSLETQVNSRMW